MHPKPQILQTFLKNSVKVFVRRYFPPSSEPRKPPVMLFKCAILHKCMQMTSFFFFFFRFYIFRHYIFSQGAPLGIWSAHVHNQNPPRDPKRKPLAACEAAGWWHSRIRAVVARSHLNAPFKNDKITSTPSASKITDIKFESSTRQQICVTVI